MRGPLPRKRGAVAIVLGVVMVVLGVASVGAVTGPGSAQPGPDISEVTICHAASATTNPYQVNTVSKNSVKNVDETENGHALHTGPIWNTSMPNNGGWGDIIPPFAAGSKVNQNGSTDEWGAYGGLNWTAEGRAIWENGCEPVTPAATATLIVRKVVVNDNGGTKGFADFSFTVNGGPAVAFDGDGEISMQVAPGDYTVVEVAVTGYTTTYDDNTVTVAADGTATVTITNDDVAQALPTTGDASVICVLPDGYYRVSGRIDGQAADTVAPATIPGNAKGVTQVVVTRGNTSHRTTVTTNGDCTGAPTETTPTETTPTDTTPTETTPTETTPTVPAPPETTPPETTPAPVSPPVTPPKAAKPTSKVAGATKTSPAPPRPTVQVKGAYKEAPSGLAYTP